MNTHEALTELRAIVVQWRTEPLDYAEMQNVLDNMVHLFAELDAHLSAGGTPPEAWREGPDR